VPASIDEGSMPGLERAELIFDATTYQLIGVNNVPDPGNRRCQDARAPRCCASPWSTTSATFPDG
jgi:hypothetical protein